MACQALLGDVDGSGQLDEEDLKLFDGLIGLSSPRAERFAYDAENRLVAVRDRAGHTFQRLWYDALGRRILSEGFSSTGTFMKATRHYYDGLAAIAEYECGPATDQPVCGTGCPPDCGTGYQPVLAREFLWGDRFPEPLAMIDHTAAGDLGAGVPETLYCVHDALGSVVGLLNDPNSLEPNSPGGGSGSSGGGVGIPARLVERYDYDPYGTTYISCRQGQTFVACDASHYGNPFMWTAQRYDAAVGLYHFLFRTYSPTLGRWMQRDPLGYVNGLNLYKYVQSAPLSFIDPLGLCTEHPVPPGPLPPVLPGPDYRGIMEDLYGVVMDFFGGGPPDPYWLDLFGRLGEHIESDDLERIRELILRIIEALIERLEVLAANAERDRQAGLVAGDQADEAAQEAAEKLEELKKEAERDGDPASWGHPKLKKGIPAVAQAFHKPHALGVLSFIAMPVAAVVDSVLLLFRVPYWLPTSHPMANKPFYSVRTLWGHLRHEATTWEPEEWEEP